MTSAIPSPSVSGVDEPVRDRPGARITVSRQSPDDFGQREIFASLDGVELAILRHGEAVTRDVEPGPHELRAHNTLFRKRQEVVLAPGEHARFSVVNRPGWGTYAMMSVLGAGPLYITIEREPDAGPAPKPS
jgi:hypothetical protein